MAARFFRGSAMFAMSMMLTSGVLACNSTPFVDGWNVFGLTTWEGNAGDCGLRAEVSDPDGAALSAAASVSYLRREPTAPLRLRFSVDTSGLPAMGVTAAVSLARGVARRVEPAASPGRPVFQVALVPGQDSSSFRLRLEGWCATVSPSKYCVIQRPADLSSADFPLDIALDVGIGAGSSGRLRLWLNSDPDTSEPYLQLNDLDNAVTGGVSRAIIGLVSTTPAFASAMNGHPFTFGHVTSSDDQLFWSGFELSIAGTTEPNRPPLEAIGVTYAGTTCGGTDLLPQAAFGTADLVGPVAVHPITMTAAFTSFSLAGPVGEGPLMMFLCPAGAGPADSCVSYGTSTGRYMPVAGVPLGEYQLVIGKHQGSCGSYFVGAYGPLD